MPVERQQEIFFIDIDNDCLFFAFKWHVTKNLSFNENIHKGPSP